MNKPPKSISGETVSFDRSHEPWGMVKNTCASKCWILPNWLKSNRALYLTGFRELRYVWRRLSYDDRVAQKITAGNLKYWFLNKIPNSMYILYIVQCSYTFNRPVGSYGVYLSTKLNQVPALLKISLSNFHVSYRKESVYLALAWNTHESDVWMFKELRMVWTTAGCLKCSHCPQIWSECSGGKHSLLFIYSWHVKDSSYLHLPDFCRVKKVTGVWCRRILGWDHGHECFFTFLK